jgi:hypothetical protein
MVLADLQHLPLYCTSRFPTCELAVGGKEKTGKREGGEVVGTVWDAISRVWGWGSELQGAYLKEPAPLRNALHLNLVQEDRKRKRKRGRGRKVHRLTRGSIRLAVVATKYQLLISLDASTSDSRSYVYSANKLHAIE